MLLSSSTNKSFPRVAVHVQELPLWPANQLTRGCHWLFRYIFYCTSTTNAAAKCGQIAPPWCYVRSPAPVRLLKRSWYAHCVHILQQLSSDTCRRVWIKCRPRLSSMKLHRCVNSPPFRSHVRLCCLKAVRIVGDMQAITAQPELRALISKLANDCFCATVTLSSSHLHVAVCFRL